jgi:hypothetical protein
MSGTGKLWIAALVMLGGAPFLLARGSVVPVRVIVEAPRAADDAYVALVPADRPWSRPEAEKIGPAGNVMLEAPEGQYRIVAGVRGAGIRISDPIMVLASRKNELRIALPAMRTIAGVVRDEEGRPLPDVAVGEASAFVEPPLGRASELAASYFAADWRTRSAADGSWSLRVADDATGPIVAESAGHATAWRSRKGAGPPEPLVLHRGAGLRLTFDREAPELVVTLSARGESPAVPPSWQAQFWARRVLKTTIVWPSLPPGDYDVYAQQWDPRTFSPAARLGTVSLQSGEARELRLQVPKAKAAARSVATVLVYPLVRLDPAAIEGFGRDANGAPRSIPSATEAVSGGTLLYLDTTGLTPPYFGTTGDRFVVLPVREDAGTATASVLDLAGAGLHLRSPNEGLPLPLAGMAVFHGCGKPQDIPLPIAVGKNGNVSFPAPAGCTSVVLDFEPFSPVVLPRPLPPGEPQWLGELTLLASGRAAIRVAAEDGSAVGNALVSIAARTDGGLEASVPVAQRITDAEGWARFDRLPAGRALGVMAQTLDGNRSAVETIRTEAARQTTVDPLRMPRPARLVVKPKLDPAFLGEFPNGRIVTVTLEPVDGNAEKRSGDVEGSDRVVFGRLLPGRWQLGAIVALDRGFQPVLGEQFEIEAGQSKEIDALLAPLVFHGRLAANLPDLSGNIDILGSKRADAVPSVEVSKSGEFTAILPRRDAYLVGVRPRATGQVLWVGNVAFTDPAVPVEIPLPRGVIVARLRADGRPLAGATVMARMPYQPTTDVPLVALPVKTGADGEARIEGLLPGPWVVFVPQNGHAQKTVTVRNEEPVRVELEVTTGLTITGTLLETFGAPVPGAKVTCLLPGPDGVPSMRLAFTGDDGSFDIGERVPRSTVLCSVTSFAGAQGYRVVAGEPARLVLPSNPATLRVTSLPELDRFSGLWLVSPDGRVIEVSPYVPRLPGPATLTIPALAPEAWKLVRVSSPLEWMTFARGGGALAGLADVTLTPDERKTVDLKTAGRNPAPAGN